MPWQFFIAIYFIFAVSHSLFTRWFSQRSQLSSRTIAAISFCCGVLPTGILIGLLGAERTISWGLETILLLLVIGVFISLFGWVSFASKKLVNVTTYQTMFQLYVVVVAALGWILLGEGLTLSQTIGGVFLLLGSYIAIYSVRRKPGKSSKEGVILAALSGITLGIVIVAERAVLDKMSSAAYFIVGYGVQALGTAILATPDIIKTPARKFTRFELAGAAACGVLAALGGATYITALTKVGNVSLVILLTTFQMPLSVIASHYILKEKDNGALLLAACFVSFIGLLVTAL